MLKDMDHTMTEMEDYLSYVGDVIEVANPRLRAEVSRKFWDGFVEPIVVGPLLAANVRVHAPLDLRSRALAITALGGLHW